MPPVPVGAFTKNLPLLVSAGIICLEFDCYRGITENLRNRLAPMSVAEFLRQRAVQVTVSGSSSLPRWYDCEGKLRTFACRTSRVSPFRMMVDVPVVGKVGERVTSYFQDFGEFQ